jgi:hypothetical protein
MVILGMMIENNGGEAYVNKVIDATVRVGIARDKHKEPSPADLELIRVWKVRVGKVLKD